MKVTYLGTTVLLFDDGKDQILFDAHTTRPSISRFLTGKLQTDEKMAEKVINTFPMDRLRGIFISHSHYDHALDLPYYANKTHAQVYGSSSTLMIARGGQVEEEKLHLFNPEEVTEIGDFKIKVIPSIHSKAKWYNDDLGQQITAPVIQPASKKLYKEGGSYDFYIKHKDKKILLRPSYIYQKNQLDGIKADVVFLGVAGISKDTEEERNTFFKETLEKVEAQLVIPVHWDNFFVSLDKPRRRMPVIVEHTDRVMQKLQVYCAEHNINCVVQLPMTSLEI